MGAYLLPALPTTVAGWPAYASFYLLGFGLAGGLLVRHGWRQRYPWQPWLLLVAGTVLALLAGTRVAAGTTADWHALLSHGRWGTGAPLGRTVLGGLVAAVLALAGLRRWLGFGRHAADAFALPLVLGLAVQGVGCLLAGCCYGTPLGTGPGLGVCYPAGTEPWAAQVAQGLLPATAAVSLPVQAAPVYQIILCLGIAAGLLAGRRQLARRPGLTWLLALGAFAGGRLALEFGHGLKPVQWGLLAATLVLLAVAARRGYFTKHNLLINNHLINYSPPVPNQPIANLTLLVLLLVLPPWLLPGQVTVAETLVLRALLLPVLVLEALRWARALRVAGPLPAGLLALGFGLMSQAPAPATPPASQFAEPARSLTVSGGGLTGSSYQLFQDYSTCNTPTANITTFPGYHQRYQAAALGVAYSQRLDETRASRLTLGVTGFLGRTNFDLPTGQVVPGGGAGYLANAAASQQLLDINPYVEYSALSRHTHGAGQLRSYLRLGFGLHLGAHVPTISW
jgi:phosphatidylglycerol:prolipoprotein diacylglycerol transferase